MSSDMRSRRCRRLSPTVSNSPSNLLAKRRTGLAPSRALPLTASGLPVARMATMPGTPLCLIAKFRVSRSTSALTQHHRSKLRCIVRSKRVASAIDVSLPPQTLMRFSDADTSNWPAAICAFRSSPNWSRAILASCARCSKPRQIARNSSGFLLAMAISRSSP
jgi:hypothetical protein